MLLNLYFPRKVILLLNVLIAIMNMRYAEVEKQEQRYSFATLLRMNSGLGTSRERMEVQQDILPGHQFLSHINLVDS